VNVTPAASFRVSLPANPVPAGTSFTVTVTALDLSGNVASGYQGTVHFTSSDGQALLPTDYTFTAVDNGSHTFTVTLKTAGSQTVSVRDTQTSTILGSGSVSVTPGMAASFRVTTSAGSVTAGAAFGLTVAALDPYGNVDTNYLGSCHLTTTDPQSPDLGTGVFRSTDHGMIGFAGIVLYTAGPQSILASGTLSGQANLMVNAAAAASFVLNVPSSVVAGGPFSLTVSALDPYGNVDTNYLGSCHLTTTDPQSPDLGTGVFTSTDHGMIGFARIVLYTAGPQSISASGTLFGQANLMVNAAAAASFVLSAPGSVVAGAPFSVTVTAYDAYGNVATGYTGTVSLTSTDPQAASLGSYTFTGSEMGVYTFNGLQLFTAGPQSIFASDGSLSAQAGLTVNPDVAASLVLTGPSSATAGTPFQVTVTAYDAWGNIATGYLGTITFSCTDAAATLPADYPFQPGDQGTQSFQATLQTSGTQRLTVTDTANPSLTAFLDVTL
jgi:hypothetical protein